MKKKIIFPLKHSYFRSMPIRIITYSKIKKNIKKFGLKDIKETINKSSRQRKSFSKEIIKKTTSNKLNKTNTSEIIRTKSFFPYKNLKTQRNLEINNIIKTNYNATFHSEKQNRKCKTKIC
jgi:hypothetical protein